MSRLFLAGIFILFSLSIFASEESVSGFNDRFELVRNSQGKLNYIKLKRATKRFTVAPFFEQIKQDVINLQNSLHGMNESELDELLMDLGMSLDPMIAPPGSQEAMHFKNSLLNIVNIDVHAAFNELDKKDFWVEFQVRLQQALDFFDPTILANLDDSRFFYRRAVTYKVVTWALEEAKKRFSNVPILNMASFIIIRIHDMMLEQRHFAHNVLLHYFEKVKEHELGMSKEEVDRAVSSIYEYRIDATNFFESSNAASNWANYGMNKFFMSVRLGNALINEWKGPLSSMAFTDVKKLNFAFAAVTHQGSRKIVHLFHKSHMFSLRPSLAFDYDRPNRVKQLRSLLNIGGVVLGFLRLPVFVQSSVDQFIKSIYVLQTRTEGALIGHFESTGDQTMVDALYAQRSNLYILP